MDPGWIQGSEARQIREDPGRILGSLGVGSFVSPLSVPPPLPFQARPWAPGWNQGRSIDPDSPPSPPLPPSGAVLGPFTVLKEDTFPGMMSPKVAQSIEGAPNFRRLGAMRIYGVGMPTVDGVIGVLK